MASPNSVTATEGDTRARIQQVALELFTERGYEATSLREIAERLGVTKAALYYHFKTKDDIIDSLITERVSEIERLFGWARARPRTPAARRDLLQRYSDLLHRHDHARLMRFFERNQSSMLHHRAGTRMRDCLMTMLDLLTDGDAPLTDQVRSSLAIFALHTSWLVLRDATDEQRRAAALEVALDLIR